MSFEADSARSVRPSISLTSSGSEQLAVIRSDTRVTGIRFEADAVSAPFSIVSDGTYHPYLEPLFPPDSVAAATDGHVTLVAWGAGVASSTVYGTVRAAFVDASGMVSAPFEVPTDRQGNAIRPRAAYVDGRFLLAWLHQEAHGDVDHWSVRARLIDADSRSALGDQEIVLVDPTHGECWGVCHTGIHTLSLSTDGSTFVVAAGGGTDEPVRVVRLDRDAAPITWTPLRINSDGSDGTWSLLEDAPRVAEVAGLTALAPLAPGRFLVLYEDLDPMTQVSRVAARQVDFGGTLR